MRVLVIAEDPRLDQYMLKPIIEAALAHSGKPRARVTVCQDSSQRGDSTVIGEQAIMDLVELYPMHDAYILCVDRDCRESREDRLTALQKAVSAQIGGKQFVAVCGVEELEVWVLAGLPDVPGPWADVRAECNPKEKHFEPHVARRSVADTPGRGRKVLGEEAAKKYGDRIRNMCPEVVACEL